MAIEAICIASATRVEETVAQLRPAVEMPVELLAVTSAVIRFHVASLNSGHFDCVHVCFWFVLFVCKSGLNNEIKRLTTSLTVIPD